MAGVGSEQLITDSLAEDHAEQPVDVAAQRGLVDRGRRVPLPHEVGGQLTGAGPCQLVEQLSVQRQAVVAACRPRASAPTARLRRTAEVSACCARGGGVRRPFVTDDLGAHRGQSGLGVDDRIKSGACLCVSHSGRLGRYHYSSALAAISDTTPSLVNMLKRHHFVLNVPEVASSEVEDR